MPRRSFTLVELMVAVSILSIGIILVLRSFLAAQDTLESLKNRLAAVELLEAKMGELELEMIEKGELAISTDEEQILLGSRKAVLKREVYFPEPEEPPLEEGAQEDLNTDFYEAKLSLSWKEGGKDKNEMLAGFIKSKK